MGSVRRFLVVVFRPLDVWVNSWLFQNSDLWYPGQTVSQFAALMRRKGHRGACVLCRFLNIFEHNHCERSLSEHDDVV